MKVSALLLLFCVFVSTSYASCPTVEFPERFQVKEEFFSFRSIFKLEQGSYQFGKIEQEIFTFRTTFQYIDKATVLFSAKDKFWSFGTVIEVFDCQERKIGELRERVWESFFKVQTKYEVVDATGNIVGESIKQDWFDVDITIYDLQNRPVANFFRPAFQWFGDKWDADFYSDSIDPRLLIFIPAFKTYVDNLRQQEESS
jgi:hypothetical protein